ncbi:bifunctional riboflavin kinase/FAD synthetase [Salinicoccus halodurans]|uniref:Riboflavin biosynthesis protein n=1 Tax=Salinicoccus halodurans TaxID=407035 RepID=A0A0F7HJY8_9STAP|nr:bifunctional riboflavin kinase/FAD synthetase [Salinicoccus halodurans]AKG73797.1 riboflavin biosynthesis protein RibF [Salinicoccus halodurans]SFK56048.1 FMN adenylyltransferase /riboflavin kinase [Salinicoccus halodurans]
MKIIRLHYPLDNRQDELKDSAAAIGFFDGLHRGHQNVINKMIEIAEEKGLKKAVMTFDPHPSVVLSPKKQRTTYLTPLDIKLEMLDGMGVDYCFIINFSSAFAALESEYFVSEYLINNKVREVIAGFDFSYGRYGKGNIDTLKANDAFNTTAVAKLTSGSEKISTTKLRDDLAAHRLEEVNDALGRPFEVQGVVVQGEKRGRTIGFPTANVEPEYRYHLPAKGVYAVTLKIDNEEEIYKGVCNVGVKPTFHDNMTRVSIEVHLFDFNRSIYGENVTVYWHNFIRKEQKFSGIDELTEQIGKDKEKAAELLENH